VLGDDGQLIVVGDHRQMPPIIKHDWQFEPRRTFAEFKSYASLFETLLELPSPPPKINFEESFRLHTAMAEFLRREIYQHEGINYHSHKTKTLEVFQHAVAFVGAALSPEDPLVVVVHNEASSMLSNPYERDLNMPLLDALFSYGPACVG
jgi:superfamily I DNA and/or RNA helicase